MRLIPCVEVANDTSFHATLTVTTPRRLLEQLVMTNRMRILPAMIVAHKASTTQNQELAGYWSLG